MKRLSPFEGAAVGGSHGRDTDTARGDRVEKRHPNKGSDQTAGPAQRERCALPLAPDPRRTAFFAIISDVEDGLLYVHEAPIEIVPFRDTELVHFAYLPAAETGEEQLVTVTPDTCFDVSRPYEILTPDTPVIVIGLDLGLAIAAEIIACMDEEAYYRPLLMRHQKSRQWYKALSGNGRQSRKGS